MKTVQQLQICPISAQLEGTPYHSPKLHPGPRSSVGTWWGTDRHADGHDQEHFPWLCLTQNV